jgi:hypothetical protein
MDVRAWAEDTTVSSDEESTSAVKLVEADVFKSRLQFGLSDRIKVRCFVWKLRSSQYLAAHGSSQIRFILLSCLRNRDEMIQVPCPSICKSSDF